jgi:PAS domain S-box-containing protein
MPSTSPNNTEPLHGWPSGNDGISALLRGLGDGDTPLGPRAGWPRSLKTTLDLMLPSQAQIVLFWGPDFIAFYNEAYAPTIGHKHPSALGHPARSSWTELWDTLEPMLSRVLTTAETIASRDHPFRIERHGFLEQVNFDISYSPVLDDDGRVGGVLCIVSETTARVRSAAALARGEAELRAAQSFTQLVLDSTSEGVHAIDREGRTTLCNARFLSMLGYGSADQVIGRRLHGEIHHSHADGSPYPVDQCPIHRAARTGQPATARGERFFRRDGSSLPVDYHVQPLWRDGELQGAVCTVSDISGRLRSEAALRQTEEDLEETHTQFRMAQAAGGIGTFSLHIATDLLTVSSEFCRVFGLPPSRTVPAAAVQALGAGEEAAAMSTAESRTVGQLPLQAEFRIRRADTGELRWIARRAEFVLDEKGRPVDMIGVVQDITLRKSAEVSLRESELRFKVLAQAMPNQVWTAAPDGRLDWFNDRIFDYSGMTFHDLVGDGWTRLVHPDDLERAAKTWADALATGSPYETEFRILRRDGSHRWHLVRALPTPGEDGSVRWIGTNTDIDEQKVHQAELSRLNLSLEERVDERTRERDRMWRLSTDIMMVSRHDGTIQAVNPAWTALLGWAESDLLGRQYLDFVHPDDLAISRSESDRLAQGRTTLRFENRYLHRDGSHRIISWTAVPDEGFVHGVGRDITAERAAAAALRETEDRLRQSQKMEAVGQLTGGIAHDFNNLLQGITGSLEVVKKRLAQDRPHEVERFVTGAINAAHRAAALTHRLLAFSRRQPLDPKPVKVNPLVGSMEELLRRTLGEHIGLEMALAGGLWSTLCDPNQLESALLNLAINARDAMPGGGKLVIRTSNVDHPPPGPPGTSAAKGPFVCIAVTDTGTGMAPEVIERAFDPFFTTKPIGQGTGLGLSMIYGFALQSEGFCKIDSALGEGTTVRLYLPQHVAADPLELPAPAPAPDGQGGRGEIVLVVEDEMVVRQLIVDVLTELGYRTLEAVDGPSGLAILQQAAQRIDLLITDIGLPGMNGRQLTDLARQHRPGLPVLFMTGYAENAARAQGFLGPGMAMITKPFAMDALALRVQDMLGG